MLAIAKYCFTAFKEACDFYAFQDNIFTAWQCLFWCHGNGM